MSMIDTIRPGVNFEAVAVVPPPSADLDTGVWHVAGLTERGPVGEAVELNSMADYTRVYGGRVSWSILYDALDYYFNQGGTRVVLSRIVGNGATPDTVTLDDAGAADSITVQTKGPGTSNLTVAVEAGTEDAARRVLVIADSVLGKELERSYELADVAAAITWSSDSDLVTVVGAGANLPAVVAATALAGGNDQHGAVTDVERAAALAFLPEGAPGQVSVPGATTTAVHTALLQHAEENNRWAVLDEADTPSDTTLRAAADGVRAGVGNPTYGGAFADWQRMRGVVRNTTRTVPPSAVAAALIARSDGATGNPNTAPAGSNGRATVSLGRLQPEWTNAQRQALNAKGVNTFRTVYGQARLYGFRTLALDTDEDPNIAGWSQATAARLRMAIRAEALALGEEFMFDQIDGARHKIAEFEGAVRGLLSRWYGMGALYGASAPESFVVNTGPQVNTDDTISRGELHVVIGIRVSPFAEVIWFHVAKYPVTQPLAA